MLPDAAAMLRLATRCLAVRRRAARHAVPLRDATRRCAAFVRRLGMLAAVAAMAVSLQGCGTTYVAQAARGQVQVLRERRPIRAVIADPATSQVLRDQLVDVSLARDFASRVLGLPDNGSYRSFVDLRRPYVTWAVVAAPELSVQPRHWCFPVAGCVAYRGYFREAAARRFADGLRAQGLDVAVNGVPAYSTLGRFADPVLSTMLGYGVDELVATLFHELSHQVLYVPGDTAFNEAFAVTVEEAGLAKWLEFRGRAADLARHRRRLERQREYVELFRRRRAELEGVYSSDLGLEEMRERKHALLAALAADIDATARRQGVRTPYESWLKQGLNNAHLASVATYYDCVPGFQRMLAAAGGDLPRFYGAVRELAKRPRDERRAAVCAASAGQRRPDSVP